MSGLSPLDDPLLAPHFEGVRAGRLLVQRCDTCRALRWPPLTGCPECRGRGATWAEVEPVGTVWSYVTYHRAFQAALRVPYSVAMIALKDGPTMVGRLEPEDREPAVGAPVVATFVEEDGVPIIVWRLA